jgi:6-pyruvoyltetrahydropterin/6-carboxytetrahydropterin synthase
MRIAKEFRWEMGHRLPLHDGACRNLHGHSYRLEVTIEGEPDLRTGMVVDFQDVSAAVKPLVAELDHCFLVQDSDAELLDYLRRHALKHTVIPFPSTVENLCRLFADRLRPFFRSCAGVQRFSTRIFETPTSSATWEEDVGAVRS